ncbi:MAG: hypothetical protein KGP28_11625, partial [Bdellovibrionales bacterium]|nr:hypothetical protein [Bdellovibrionales bacterium]
GFSFKFFGMRAMSPTNSKVGKFFTAEYLSGGSKVKVDYVVLPEVSYPMPKIDPGSVYDVGSEPAEGAQKILTCEFQGEALGGKRFRVIPMAKIQVSSSSQQKGALSLAELPSHFFLPAGSREFRDQVVEIGFILGF